MAKQRAAPEQRGATTPVYGLPYPASGDTPDVVRDVTALATRVEAVLPTISPPQAHAYADALANRPSVGSVVPGSTFYATDTHDVYIAQGGAWLLASGVLRVAAFAQPIVGVSNKQTYGDPNTGTAGSTGPALTGLVDGVWQIAFGAIASQDAAGTPGHSPMYMAVALNGVMPGNDLDATWHRNGYESNVGHTQIVTLSVGSGGNSVKVVYRGGDNSNGHWINRYITGIRLGP